MASSDSASRIIIEPAILANATAIASIGRETFRASFAHSMSPEDMQHYLDSNYVPEVIARDMSGASNTFFIAREQAPLQSQQEQQQQQQQQNNPVITSTGGEVLGFMQLKRGTTEPCLPTDVPLLELHRIYMHTSHNGRGIGKLLVEAAHAVAVQESFKGIWLGVWEENLRAQQFYKRLGYENVGYHDFVIGNKIDLNDVLLKMF